MKTSEKYPQSYEDGYYCGMLDYMNKKQPQYHFNMIFTGDEIKHSFVCGYIDGWGNELGWSTILI